MNKILNKITEIGEYSQEENKNVMTIYTIFEKIFKKNLKWEFDTFKNKGYSARLIIINILIISISKATSIYDFVTNSLTKGIEAQKDVFYRLINNIEINWSKMFLKTIKSTKEILKKNYEKLIIRDDPEEKEGYLIVDDTLIKKTGKTIEYVTKVFDHTKKQLVFGYKLLVLNYYDGKTIYPLDFSMHREKGKNGNGGLKAKELKKQQKRTKNMKEKGYSELKEIDEKKPDSLIKMIKKAIKNGIKARYLIADKWFFSEKILNNLKNLSKGKIDFLGACKIDNKEFEVAGYLINLKEIIAIYKKSIKRCRAFNIKYIEVYAEYKGIPVKLFFNKPKKRNDWELLITTNLKLRFIDAFEIYTTRWTIEIFFRDCKQYLNLENCSSMSFKAQKNHIGFVFLNFIVLSFCKRVYKMESLGGIFKDQYNQIFVLSISEKIKKFIFALLKDIDKLLNLNLNNFFNQIDILNDIIHSAINKILPDNIKREKIIF